MCHLQTTTLVCNHPLFYPCRTGCFLSPTFLLRGASVVAYSTVCPVCALHIYLDRIQSFRESNQLFVSWVKPHVGKPVSKQHLSHRIVMAIALAYTSKGLQIFRVFIPQVCATMCFTPDVCQVLQVGCHGSKSPTSLSQCHNCLYYRHVWQSRSQYFSHSESRNKCYDT